MSVSVTDPVAGPFYPNGATTAFPFDFKAMSSDEVAVVDDTGIPIGGLSYSVALNADEGGVVTFATAPTAVALPSFFIMSDPDFKQLTQYGSVGTFNPRTLNSPLDRQAVATLALRAQVGRAITAPLGETPSPLPSAAQRAGNILAFDVAGNPALQPLSTLVQQLGGSLIADGSWGGSTITDDDGVWG